ncbi:MAG: D-erythronate dehydrogenase [Pseudomonadota bacterium]
MTRVLIIGGGGMVGQKLAAHIAQQGLRGDASPDVTLFDRAFPASGAPGRAVSGDLTDSAAIQSLVSQRFDVIFHLAAIVSGEAEVDFAKGWTINGTAFLEFAHMIEAEHRASEGAWVPRLVFTSSIAVYGPPFPDPIPDDFPPNPQTSYGAQKACGELVINDLGRRGIAESVAIRLPTIAVRPGAPNKAASSFFSGIIREPLQGQEAILPVSPEVRHWHASPRAAVAFCVHAATLDAAALEGSRVLLMPGVSCTVGEQIEALRRVAGEKPVALIRAEPDDLIKRIVAGWPHRFAPERALALGFQAEPDFDTIIRIYIEDEMGGAEALKA